jgi:hypothetical protein
MTDNTTVQPRRPSHISSYAEVCLEALATHGLGDKVSLGGAFGLLHYLDYRSTHDVDAWWVQSTTMDEQQQVISVIKSVLESFGQVRERVWGDVVSLELVRDGKTVFGFQIAQRSAQLQPCTAAPWTGMLLDSFPDLVASKMVALVERGAPRDLRDIHALCQARLVTPARCWQLWRQRQRLAGSDASADRARLALETHLARIAQHRPLDQIEDATERAAAEQVRAWFKTEFLDALVD